MAAISDITSVYTVSGLDGSISLKFPQPAPYDPARSQTFDIPNRIFNECEELEATNFHSFSGTTGKVFTAFNGNYLQCDGSTIDFYITLDNWKRTFPLTSQASDVLLPFNIAFITTYTQNYFSPNLSQNRESYGEATYAATSYWKNSSDNRANNKRSDYIFGMTTDNVDELNLFLLWAGGFETPPDFGEDSTTGGGQGNWDISSDVIDFPLLPTGSALATGLINMYKCDSSDLNDFGEYLWGDNFFNQISKIFNDPMESFVSLNLFPVSPAASETKTPIKIGNLFASKSASEFVTAYPLTSQYLEFNCGTVNVNEFFGSALDYNPYTQVQIYLPFIGFQNLSVDDIMDGTITLKYHIDLLTGTCTALIKCEKSNKYNLASVLYSFAGSMNMSVPISSSTYAQAGQTLITAMSGIGLGLATGGTGTAVSAAAAGSAMNMLNAKAQIQRSGGVTMNAGALGNLTPYIIITRPIQHKPEDYQKFKGWENNITYTLSALQGKGYTEIMYTHVEGMTATDVEKTEIENLLKEGVIL